MDIKKLGNTIFEKILLIVHYKQAQSLGLEVELPDDLSFSEEELYNLLQYAEIISHGIDDNQRIKAVTIIALLSEVFKNKYIVNKDLEDVLRKTSTNILINLGLSVTAQMLNEESNYYYSVDNVINELVLGSRIKESSIEINGKTYTLSSFQKRVWDGITQHTKIAISAPTSAGKSFALNLKIIDLMLSSGNDTVTIYIVPTISLINQDCSDLKSYLQELSVDNIKVLQAVSDKFENEKAIYVLTQERVLTAINNYTWLKTKLKYLVVDEIQNIEKVSNDSEERSLILLEALNSINEEFELEKEILAGARIKNINEFNKKFLGEESFSISDELPTVINLTYSFSRVKNARNAPIQFTQKVTSLKEGETTIRVNDNFD